MESNPNIVITTNGTYMTKKNYNWASNPTCLFYKSKPICYKSYGIVFCDIDNADFLQPIFEKLNIIAYTYVDNIDNFTKEVNDAFNCYYRSATGGFLVDPPLLEFIQKFNCQYENKYLNYVSRLDPEQYLSAVTKYAKKHKKSHTVYELDNDGLWYIKKYW